MAAIYDKLLQIQQNLSAPKNQRNSFGNYNYRSCEDILQAVKPLLKETKTILQLSDDVKVIGEWVYVLATAKLVEVETGESTETYGFAREEATKKGMDSSQITGAASSYARKYALNGLFAIDDNKDSDATNTGPEKKPEPKPEKKDLPPEVIRETLPKPADLEGPKPQIGVDGYFHCQDCGKVIKHFLKNNGDCVKAEEIAGMTLKKYGRQLCSDCGAKYKNGN